MKVDEGPADEVALEIDIELTLLRTWHRDTWADVAACWKELGLVWPDAASSDQDAEEEDDDDDEAEQEVDEEENGDEPFSDDLGEE